MIDNIFAIKMQLNYNCLNTFIDNLIQKVIFINNNNDVFNDFIKNDMRNTFEQFMIEDIESRAENHEIIMRDIEDYLEYLKTHINIEIDYWFVIYLYRFTITDYYDINFNLFDN